MEITIRTIGGYEEVGKNMTAIKIGDEVVICDLGLHLPKIIDFEEEGGVRENISRDELLEIGAIPDYNLMEDWRDKVKAIVISHCHLDHLGAVPYLAGLFNAPIIGTPYTIEVLKSMLRDEEVKLRNPLKVVNQNSILRISRNIKIELVGITHSTPQSSMIAIHTPEGVIVYANDFKFDNHPILGKKPNYQRLKELGKQGVLALIVESLYTDRHMKTPSEKVAKEMLKDVMLGTLNQDYAVIVTTFASHIARLKSIVEFGKKMRRKIVFLGRSLHRYVSAAEKVKIVNFSKDVEVVGYAAKIRKMLKKIEKEGASKYLIVCTGNQGEPKSTLARMATGEIPFSFRPRDQVIFSCTTIPSSGNIANREILEEKLRKKGLRIFKDIHTSGHASREDHRDLIDMLKPKHIFPAHGDVGKLTSMAELANEMGYVLGETIHLMRDGREVNLV